MPPSKSANLCPRVDSVSADWMKPPVADTPNNWTEVTRNFASQSDADKYVAAVGKKPLTWS
jgi:hypothetical protein